MTRMRFNFLGLLGAAMLVGAQACWADQAALFPTSLPGPDWVEFKAEGFSQPVTGVIYRNGESAQGIPLGGLGTGFITLQTDGTLDYFSTIFNAFLERHAICLRKELREQKGAGPATRHRSDLPSLRLPFLGLAVGDKTWVLSVRKVEGIEGARQVHYWGHYPIADLEYEIDAPIGVSLRAWAPFYPGDAVSSNIPGAVFLVRLYNKSNTVQRGKVAFSFHGPRQEEVALNSGQAKEYITPPLEYERQSVQDDFAGVVVQTTWDSKLYGYGLGIIGGARVESGGELVGKAWNALAHSLPAPAPTDAGASVAIPFSLKPGEAKTVPFVLSWYAPIWNALEWNLRYTRSENSNMYAARFKSAREVAAHLSRQHSSLLRRILAWQEVLYGEQRLSGWLRDSLVNVFAVLPQESFWLKSTNPNHWWGAEGLFTANESLISCPQMACLANDEFGEWPVNIFFPKLARNKLRQFKYYQKANGQVPSTLGVGTEPDQPWYDQQLTMDGQIYCQMVDRYWQVTGDDTILKEFYPSVKAQLKFMFTVDRDGDGLLDVRGSNQYYDDWKSMAGAAIHVSGYWLATLRMVERMAEKMDDPAFAEECRSWYQRGSRSMEEKLWNEKASSYLLYHQPQTGKRSDTVLSDQLIGQYFAHLHGLKPIFPKERVKKVLETIWRNNLTPFGVRLALKPDGSPDTEGFYSTAIHPSYSTIVPASVQVYEGDPAKGDDLMRRTWRHLVINLKMAWEMPGGLEPDGKHRWGLEYYHNTMLWSYPVAVLNKTLRTFCTPGELVDRMVRAARGQ